MRFNALSVISCVAAIWHYAVGSDVRGESKPLGLAHRSASLRRHHHKGASHHHVAVESNRKAVVGSAEDASASQMRPIITGCLKECGYTDQTCITQCQVCIEQNECRILHKCDPCLQGAHDQMVLAKKTDKGILDSGGVALVRDGLMADMTSANLESLERKRLLRTARTGVLMAQREAEWARSERQHSSKNLVEARTTLRIARLEVTRWTLQNEKKLKKMRAQAAQQRRERQTSERKLAEHKRAYSKAQKRLRVASKSGSNMSAQEEEQEQAEEGTDEDAENKTATKETEGEEIYKLAKDVEERQTAVENAERELEKTSADGEWLDRGLRRRVKAAQEGARSSREELLEARARERVSRERLEEAKDHYIASVKSSNVADEAAHDSEIKLRKAPVSLYPGGPAPPASASAKITDQDKTAVVVVLPHSSALRLQGVAWLTALAVLAVHLAIGA